MNTATRDYVKAQLERQRDYATALTESAHNGSIEARALLPHAVAAANALHSLTLCEACMYPERRLCEQQADKFGRRATEAEEGSTIALYNALIASIFTELAPKCADIGEPLEVEEGEETEDPLTVPTEWPAPTREPVPA